MTSEFAREFLGLPPPDPARARPRLALALRYLIDTEEFDTSAARLPDGTIARGPHGGAMPLRDMAGALRYARKTESEAVRLGLELGVWSCAAVLDRASFRRLWRGEVDGAERLAQAHEGETLLDKYRSAFQAIRGDLLLERRRG